MVFCVLEEAASLSTFALQSVPFCLPPGSMHVFKEGGM